MHTCFARSHKHTLVQVAEWILDTLWVEVAEWILDTLWVQVAGWISFSCRSESEISSGESIEDALEAIEQSNGPPPLHPLHRV